MGTLSSKERNKLPDSDFALPGRQYPIPDIEHARNALARVAQNGTPDEQAKVKAAVYRRYPSLKPTTEKVSWGGSLSPKVNKTASGYSVGDNDMDDTDMTGAAVEVEPFDFVDVGGDKKK